MDFVSLGLSVIQVRRFHRLWHELNQNESELSSSAQEDHDQHKDNSSIAKSPPKMFGLTVLQKTKPWQDKKFGYLPNPVTERALFLNSVLPLYYDSQWKWSKNAKEFVKGFHTEGRKQCDIKKKIECLNTSYSYILDEKKPYSAGSFIAGETPLKPTDSQRIQYSISCLNELKVKVERLKDKMKEEDDKLFTKLGKVRSGNECAHQFLEKSVGNLIDLIRKTDRSICDMEGILKKHKQMFPSAKESYTTKKRRKKENKAKSKKRKLARKTKNCSQLLQQIILCEENPDEQIDSVHINDKAISKLNNKDARWLKILILEDTRFTADALSKIKGSLKKDLLPIVFGELEEPGSSDDDVTDVEEIVY